MIRYVCIVLCIAVNAVADDIPVVHVQPGQTLNAAIAAVDGPVRIMLPPGVTEHDAAITRSDTVIITGKGEGVSTLRPAAGVALINQSTPFDGDLILADFTYDRNHQPGVTPGTEHPGVPGATVLHVAAGGTVEMRNVAIHHFDFGAREGVDTSTLAFNYTANHQKEITFRNVNIDFKQGGGIRHRPGARSRAFDFGDVDRLTFDKDCLVRGHLCQVANPEYTVGPVWRNRGTAGTMYGMNARVYERALIDGAYHECDYGASRSVSPATEDAVIEWRMDLIDAGYGDQFWQGRLIDGGHMIFRDVVVQGHRTGHLWNDYGLRTFGSWKTITVENCTIINRGHPLAFCRAKHTGSITVRNVKLAPSKGGRTALLIRGFETVGDITIENVEITADPGEANAYYTDGIHIEDVKAGGPVTIRNVHASGFLQKAFENRIGPDVAVDVSNLTGEQATFTLPEGYDLALMNRAVANPRAPRPDYHYGAEMPGYFRGTEPLQPVDGETSIKWGQVNLSFTKDHFQFYGEYINDDAATIRDGDFATADRFIIGLALGPRTKADHWFEIEIAAAEGDNANPMTQTRVRMRRYPDGQVVSADRIEAGLFHHTRGRARWAVRVPWQAVGIDPMEESFFIERRVCVDVAFVDVDGDAVSQRYQLMGKSGVLDDKNIHHFKEAFLHNVDWDDTPEDQ